MFRGERRADGELKSMTVSVFVSTHAGGMNGGWSSLCKSLQVGVEPCGHLVLVLLMLLLLVCGGSDVGVVERLEVQVGVGAEVRHWFHWAVVAAVMRSNLKPLHRVYHGSVLRCESQAGWLVAMETLFR